MTDVFKLSRIFKIKLYAIEIKLNISNTYFVTYPN